MILEELEKKSLEIINNFNNSKEICKNKIENIVILDIYDNIEEYINELHNNFKKYHENYELIRNFLNKLLECQELDLEDIQLQELVDEFYTVIIQYTELINNNYNNFEICLDNSLNTIIKAKSNKYNDNIDGIDDINNLLVNLKTFKKNKTNYFYSKFYKSLETTYKEYIHFIENKIKHIFELKIGNKNKINFNYI